MKKETIKTGLHKSEIAYIQVDGITHIINSRKSLEHENDGT